MNRKLLTVIKREYLVRVRAKGFVVLTVLIPAIIAGFIILVGKLGRASENVSTRLAVVDQSEQLYPQLESAFDGKLSDGRPEYALERVTTAGANVDDVRHTLSARVLAGDLDGYLVLPADVLESRQAELHVRNAAALGQDQAISSRIATAINRTRMLQAGIPGSEVDHMASGVKLEKLKVAATGDLVDEGQSTAVAWVLVIVLYVFLIMYGVTVMRSVTEEKTTRISEILLASVDSFSLMLGKILGVAGAALTQFVVWGVFIGAFGAYALAMAKASGVTALSAMPQVGIGLYISFVVFFILGFLVYAGIYASIGAVVSSEQEANQSQIPVSMLLVIAYICAIMVMNNPNAPLSVVLSLVPFFSPILMTLRIAVANPPLWQVGLAIAICVATVLLLTKVTAKIYRVGILMTGKRPNLPEIIKWLKYA